MSLAVSGSLASSFEVTREIMALDPIMAPHFRHRAGWSRNNMQRPVVSASGVGSDRIAFSGHASMHLPQESHRDLSKTRARQSSPSAVRAFGSHAEEQSPQALHFVESTTSRPQETSERLGSSILKRSRRLIERLAPLEPWSESSTVSPVATKKVLTAACDNQNQSTNLGLRGLLFGLFLGFH